MKKFLSLVAICTLSVSMLTATAQDQPKKAAVKETKTSCCATKSDKKDCAKDEKCAKDAKCDMSKCGDSHKSMKHTDAKKADAPSKN
jgi:hypothetical protein